MTEYRPLLDVIVEAAGSPPMPDGYDRWAFRTVHSDFRSSRGYRWPFPGQVAAAPGPILDHRRSCPKTGATGDGICVATTAAGMASGGISAANPVLLCAVRDGDIVGDSERGKWRVREALVVEVVNLPQANLRYANLRGANLRGANLRGANLRGANLGDANLRGANLGDANLGDANLRGANLRAANLRYANLGYADLRGADLRYANLRAANLRGADLGGWKRGSDGYARRAETTQ